MPRASPVPTIPANSAAGFPVGSNSTGLVHSEETLDLGGTGVLMQGGLHPDLKIEWYEEMLRAIRDGQIRACPAVMICSPGLSPPVISTTVSRTMPLRTPCSLG